LGGCIFLGWDAGAVASWSRNDTTVAHSSAEVEIKAIDMWILEALHIVEILELSLNYIPDEPIKLYVDSKSAIDLCTTLKSNHKTKHINMRINFIREQILRGFLVLCFVAGEDNVADMLTKPLTTGPFQGHRAVLMQGHGGKQVAHVHIFDAASYDD
jgi:hypothetical protein